MGLGTWNSFTNTYSEHTTEVLWNVPRGGMAVELLGPTAHECQLQEALGHVA